jgi:acyl carrier protein
MTDIKNSSDIKVWVSERIAEKAGITVDEINKDLPFSAFSIDSLYLAEISGEIEEKFGIKLNPLDLFEFHSINKLSDHIFSLL